MKPRGNVLVALAAVLAVIVLCTLLLFAASSFSQPSRPPALGPTASESPTPTQAQYNASSPITSEEDANQTQSNVSNDINDVVSEIESIKDILK